MNSSEMNDCELIKQYIDVIAKQEQIGNYDVKFSNVCNIGDNYMGNVVRVKITGNNNEKKIQVSVIIKTVNLDNNFITPIHLREMQTYRDVLPKLKEFQDKYNIDNKYHFKFIKCFSATNNIMILEDLSEYGCKVADKFTSPDFTYASKVITELAKLHGLSFAMEKLEPDIFKKLANNHVSFFWDRDNLEKGFDKLSYASYDNSLRFVRNKEAKKKLEDLRCQLFDLMKKFCSPREHNVIAHGDLWTTNILFKCINGEPKEVYFVDWQMSRYSSPVNDIYYYIFMCTDSEFRKKHYEKLLEIYHSSLSRVLEQYDLDVNEVYSIEAFHNDLKELSFFALFYAMILFRYTTVKPEFVPDIVKIINDEEILKGDPCDGLKLFEDRLNDTIEDFIKYGYL